MIRIGPSGGGLSSVEGMHELAELGLNACEIPFTYGVWMKTALAVELAKIAKKLDIALSVHAPYYINLASLERQKIKASKSRILESCERAHELGATHVVFHAGFYHKREPSEVYEIIKEEILDLQQSVKEKGWKVKLAPETTGKGSQFGTVDELMQLSKETKCSMCIDFAHIYARNIGKIDYDGVFSKIKSVKHIHAHFSGIEFGQKGERHHKITSEKFLLPLIEAIKKYKPDITIINESPDPVRDSVKTKLLVEKICGK